MDAPAAVEGRRAQPYRSRHPSNLDKRSGAIYSARVAPPGIDAAAVGQRERAGLGLLAAWWGRGLADVRQALQ